MSDREPRLAPRPPVANEAPSPKTNPNSLRRQSLGAALVGLLSFLVVGACARVGVDADTSSQALTPVATASSESNPAPPTVAGAWTIAELKQHQELSAEQVVSVHGVLKEFQLCQDCPPDAACAPCAYWFTLGTHLGCSAEQTVGFTNTRSAMRPEFQVGKRYVFSGTLRERRDPGAGHPTFVNFDYHSHRALD